MNMAKTVMVAGLLKPESASWISRGRILAEASARKRAMMAKATKSTEKSSSAKTTRTSRMMRRTRAISKVMAF